jgi:hypothetical protein
MKLFGKLILVLVLCTGVLFVLRQVTYAKQAESGNALPSLQLTVGFDSVKDEHAATPKFRVTLRNNSENDLCLNIGFLLANGKMQFPQAISLSVVDATGKTLPLGSLKPGYIAGRVDPYILPLPAGGLFSFSVELKDYVAGLPKDNGNNGHLRPGAYSFVARFASQGVKDEGVSGDARLMPLWAGAVTSNQLKIVLSPE